MRRFCVTLFIIAQNEASGAKTVKIYTVFTYFVNHRFPKCIPSEIAFLIAVDAHYDTYRHAVTVSIQLKATLYSILKQFLLLQDMIVIWKNGSIGGLTASTELCITSRNGVFYTAIRENIFELYVNYGLLQTDVSHN